MIRKSHENVRAARRITIPRRQTVKLFHVDNDRLCRNMKRPRGYSPITSAFVLVRGRRAGHVSAGRFRADAALSEPRR
jgi:hypothetical protein